MRIKLFNLIFKLSKTSLRSKTKLHFSRHFAEKAKLLWPNFFRHFNFFFNRRDEIYFNAPQKGEDATSCTLGLEWASGFLLSLSRAWHVR